MYFKTCFVPIFDSFIWFAGVLLENLKKLGNYYFFEYTMLVLILSNLKNSLFYCIGSFIKAEQHKICHPTLNFKSNIKFDYISWYQNFSLWGLPQKAHHFGFSLFLENDQGARSDTLGFYNLKD